MKELLSDKVILITGATDGLGKLLTQHLAMQDAALLVHGRNPEKGKLLTDELTWKTHHNKIIYYNGDYASLQEVKALSDKIRAEQNRIDILINNVGIGSGSAANNKREISIDGIEMRFAVNYLSHVLLTERLLPLLKPGAQIINVASVGQEPIDFDNLMLEKNYDGFFAYKRSKTALIMYTFDLADRLKDHDVKVNAIHPASLMNTKMVLEGWGYSLTTVDQGAEAVESLLFSDTTGAYYDGKKVSKAIAQTYDIKARTILRDISSKILENYL